MEWDPGRLRHVSTGLWRGGARVDPGGEGGLASELEALAEEELGASVRRLRVPVERWVARGAGLEPQPGWLVVEPYSPPADVEGPPAFVAGDASEPASWRRFPEGSVAVALEPPNPDDLKAAALLAWEAGAVALVLLCRRRRVIVGTGVWGYPYWAGGPMPVPVACAPRGASQRLLATARVRLWVDARVEASWGVTLEADAGGREPLAAFGAHLDRWPGGFADDTLGLAQALAAASLASREGVAVRLLYFTAEEHGAPGAPGWYWAWGSRLYFTELAAAGLDEALAAYVNYDVASRGPVASGAPPLTAAAGGLVAGLRGLECPECDSFQAAAWAGVPTLSLHSLWAPGVREWYHTPDDAPELVDWDAAWRAVLAGARAAVAAARGGLDWRHASAALRGLLAGGPLRARRILYLIEAAAARAGWERVYRALARRELRAVHWGSYRHGSGDLEAALIPEAECVRRALRGESFDEAVVAGEERVACAGGRGWVLRQAQWILARAEERVEEALRGLLA